MDPDPPAAPPLPVALNPLSEVTASLIAGVVRAAEVKPERRVFCNRNLRLDEIELVGFDMDYTLALYHQRRIEELSIERTLDKLVKKRGYPEALLGLDYDHGATVKFRTDREEKIEVLDDALPGVFAIMRSINGCR